MELCPSKHMLQRKLSNGWKVIEKIESDPTINTGGHFSVAYIVEKDNIKAFMKVISFESAHLHPRFMEVIQSLTSSFNFEREVLKICNVNKLDKIVRLIDSGEEYIEGYFVPAAYIIFEIASNGDIRKFMDSKKSFDLAWIFRSLHHATIGMSQLHKQGIAHQDVKPSNILVFNENESKIADFGRASIKGVNSPHENLNFAGDLSYAPIEILYGHTYTEWNEKKFGADLYLLGSLVMFYFTKTSMTACIELTLAPQHRPKDRKNPNLTHWQGSYSEVYPYVEDAFSKILEEVENTLDFDSKADIVRMIGELCHPDIKRRGHPSERVGIGNQYSLEKYISLLDLLATRAEIKFKKDVSNESE